MKNKSLTMPHGFNMKQLDDGIAFLETHDATTLQRALTAMAYKQGIKITTKVLYASDGKMGTTLVRIELIKNESK